MKRMYNKKTVACNRFFISDYVRNIILLLQL